MTTVNMKTLEHDSRSSTKLKMAPVRLKDVRNDIVNKLVI